MSARRRRGGRPNRHEQELKQKTTFTRWVNHKLVQGGFPPLKGEELERAFMDGVKLIELVHALTGFPIPKHRKDTTQKFHKVDNIQKALTMIEDAGFNIPLLHNDHIADGNLKMVLGMVWMMILNRDPVPRITINTGDKTPPKKKRRQIPQDALLKWCRYYTKRYRNVHPPGLKNFTSDFESGLVFCALYNKFRPDEIEYDHNTTPEEALEKAFTVGENLGVPRLLEPDEVVNGAEEKSIMAYVLEMYSLFSSEFPPVEDDEAIKGDINPGDMDIAQEGVLFSKKKLVHQDFAQSKQELVHDLVPMSIDDFQQQSPERRRRPVSPIKTMVDNSLKSMTMKQRPMVPEPKALQNSKRERPLKADKSTTVDKSDLTIRIESRAASCFEQEDETSVSVSPRRKKSVRFVPQLKLEDPLFLYIDLVDREDIVADEAVMKSEYRERPLKKAAVQIVEEKDLEVPPEHDFARDPEIERYNRLKKRRQSAKQIEMAPWHTQAKNLKDEFLIQRLFLSFDSAALGEEESESPFSNDDQATLSHRDIMIEPEHSLFSQDDFGPKPLSGGLPSSLLDQPVPRIGRVTTASFHPVTKTLLGELKDPFEEQREVSFESHTPDFVQRTDFNITPEGDMAESPLLYHGHDAYSPSTPISLDKAMTAFRIESKDASLLLSLEALPLAFETHGLADEGTEFPLLADAGSAVQASDLDLRPEAEAWNNVLEEEDPAAYAVETTPPEDAACGPDTSADKTKFHISEDALVNAPNLQKDGQEPRLQSDEASYVQNDDFWIAPELEAYEPNDSENGYANQSMEPTLYDPSPSPAPSMSTAFDIQRTTLQENDVQVIEQEIEPPLEQDGTIGITSNEIHIAEEGTMQILQEDIMGLTSMDVVEAGILEPCIAIVPTTSDFQLEPSHPTSSSKNTAEEQREDDLVPLHIDAISDSDLIVSPEKSDVLILDEEAVNTLSEGMRPAAESESVLRANQTTSSGAHVFPQVVPMPLSRGLETTIEPVESDLEAMNSDDSSDSLLFGDESLEPKMQSHVEAYLREEDEAKHRRKPFGDDVLLSTDDRFHIDTLRESEAGVLHKRSSPKIVTFNTGVPFRGYAQLRSFSITSTLLALFLFLAVMLSYRDYAAQQRSLLALTAKRESFSMARPSGKEAIQIPQYVYDCDILSEQELSSYALEDIAHIFSSISGLDEVVSCDVLYDDYLYHKQNHKAML